MTKLNIKKTQYVSLEDILNENNYEITTIDENTLCASIDVDGVGKVDTIIVNDEVSLYFQTTICNAEQVKDQFSKLLDLNTSIAPASIGIDTEGDVDELVITNRVPTENLDDNEVVHVLNSIIIAIGEISTVIA